MKEINKQIFKDERSLFGQKDLHITDSIFDVGESPLKETSHIEAVGTQFKYKYPLWYASNVHLKDCYLFEMARAGIWYTNDITVEDTMVEAPKEFRRCRKVTLKNVSFSNAEETLWNCQDVTMENVTAKGPYFAMNMENARIDHLEMFGNYCFDGAKNVEVHHSRFLSKDCFWNSENITIYDSFISGEYLAWNSKNVTLINCTIESLQGLCYIDNLVMKNCRMINTTMAFEYCDVNAEITGSISSILNPSSGVIKADHIDKLILQKEKVDPSKTTILCPSIGLTTEVISDEDLRG